MEFLPHERLKSSRIDVRDADADALGSSSDSSVFFLTDAHADNRHAISASILSIQSEKININSDLGFAEASVHPKMVFRIQ